MENKKIRLLICSDGVVPTGFSRVMHAIVHRLPKEDYEIKWLSVNYFGDPHQYTEDAQIYPAASRGDVYGLNRVGEFYGWADEIFILNDAWIIDQYLKVIKDKYEKVPPITVYIPVDAKEHWSRWYSNFDIVTKVIAYTEFGKEEIYKACKREDIIVIGHGVDTEIFNQLHPNRQAAKFDLYPADRDDLLNSFIVLNCSRNQPRKKLEVAMQGFKYFSENKPENVKYYSHCGIVDMAIDVAEYAGRIGISDRLVVTNLENGVQKVANKNLNLIYNATDVGINTSLGEGWGLPSMEHAVTGAPQLVPGSSACEELWWDCGVLIPAKIDYLQDQIMTIGRLIRPEDVATCLEDIYVDKLTYASLADKAKDKFTSDEYNWDTVAKKFDKVLKEAL